METQLPGLAARHESCGSGLRSRPAPLAGATDPDRAACLPDKHGPHSSAWSSSTNDLLTAIQRSASNPSLFRRNITEESDPYSPGTLKVHRSTQEPRRLFNTKSVILTRCSSSPTESPQCPLSGSSPPQYPPKR